VEQVQVEAEDTTPSGSLRILPTGGNGFLNNADSLEALLNFFMDRLLRLICKLANEWNFLYQKRPLR